MQLYLVKAIELVSTMTAILLILQEVGDFTASMSHRLVIAALIWEEFGLQLMTSHLIPGEHSEQS